MERLLLNLDPASITEYISIRTPVEKARFNLSGLFLPQPVRRGSWDRQTYPMEDHPTFRLIRRLYESDYDLPTGMVALEQYFGERGLSPLKARDKAERKGAEILWRYAELARGMADTGYQPGLARDEIGVAIARDGTLLKAPGGQHRFAVARMLGLDCVTAEVRYIHRAWQRACKGADLESLRTCTREQIPMYYPSCEPTEKA
ncbi:hypothetical protein SAMN05660831_01542 [Thiohalospira halophila DSM 15071]|uniref:Uncharacterized protein n=1 Tax=Thiohalospira halophila DSM 15071 TaxID=1123397 RepID=A0A1I1RR46_9GAMM|nr:hypothetical protein [Thiohalospira halophila]SFD36786.1 hypothetical protein SAMN05660831_01542 [Thiohalospira halophila DSM 15071]